MKHLKLYESTDKNLYYKKIDRESSEKMIAIELSKETIMFLNKRLKDSNTNTLYVEYSRITYFYFGHYINAIIYELPDEWYLVKVSKKGTRKISNFFLCDQLEGLDKCINDTFTPHLTRR